MLKYLITSIRAVFFAALLTCAVPVAHAGPTREYTHTNAVPTAHTTGEASQTDRAGATTDGIFIIVGIVGAVVLFAWVCSRFGDNRQPTIMR